MLGLSSLDRRARRVLERVGLARGASIPFLLTGLAVLGSCLYIGGFLAAGVLRVLYPYPLDRTEEASVSALRHLTEGYPLYGPPTLTYVPVVYPPLYFYLGAAVATVLGPSLLTLRSLSLAASIVAAALTYALVRRETSRRVLGLVSCAVFVGSTHISLTTLDLARVDALGTALMLGAIYVLRTADFATGIDRRASAAAGILAGLSVLTKQPHLLVAIALLGYTTLNARTRLLPYLIGLVASIVLPLLLLYAEVGDWLRVWLVDLPSLHVVEQPHVDVFWSANMFARFTLPLVLGPLYFVARAAQRDLRAVVLFGLSTVTMLAMAWGGWAARGSSENVLEPAYAGLSILFGLAVYEALRLLDGADRNHQIVRRYIQFVCAAQLVVLGYNPRATVPPRSDVWAGDRLVAMIQHLPGTVLAPDFTEWAFAAGKGDQPSMGAALELSGAFASTETALGLAWQGDFLNALQARAYDYVLWDPQSDGFEVKSAIDAAGYVSLGSPFPANDQFNQWKTRRTPDVELYVPSERVPASIRAGLADDRSAPVVVRE